MIKCPHCSGYNVWGMYIECNPDYWHEVWESLNTEMSLTNENQYERLECRDCGYEWTVPDWEYKITTPSGYIQINVPHYFVKAHKSDINKLLKVAKQYGNDTQRNKLINKLFDAKQYWLENYTNAFFTWTPRTKRQLVKVLNKLQDYISVLNMDYWGD